MATVYSYEALDLTAEALDFNWFIRSQRAVHIEHNVILYFTNGIYADAFTLDGWDTLTFQSIQSIQLLGPQILFDETGKISGGTVTAIYSFWYDFDHRFLLEDISVSAKLLYDAFLTASNTDDAQVWKMALKGDDTFLLSYFDDIAHGYAGNDTLNGANGADELYGDSGNDTLDGSVGIDRLFGGSGNDTYYVDNLSDGVFENVVGNTNLDTGGIDLVISRSDFYTLPKFVENIKLASYVFAHTAYGNNLANRITGNEYGNGLFGNGGKDILIGGAGADTLIGGGGKDVMTGGSDSDLFKFESSAHISKGLGTRDIIRDFYVDYADNVDDDDIIDLSLIDANTSVVGDQQFIFRAAEGKPFTGVRGQLIWDKQDNSGTANDRTLIKGDANGDRIADFELELTGLKNLYVADFIL
jgi:Ca2+-binding RTX toxin-like protein